MRSGCGQLSDDRRECVGDLGAEDEVGKAELLPTPLDLLGRGHRGIRKDSHRVRGAPRSRVGYRQVPADARLDLIAPAQHRGGARAYFEAVESRGGYVCEL